MNMRRPLLLFLALPYVADIYLQNWRDRARNVVRLLANARHLSPSERRDMLAQARKDFRARKKNFQGRTIFQWAALLGLWILALDLDGLFYSVLNELCYCRSSSGLFMPPRLVLRMRYRWSGWPRGVVAPP